MTSGSRTRRVSFDCFDDRRQDVLVDTHLEGTFPDLDPRDRFVQVCGVCFGEHEAAVGERKWQIAQERVDCPVAAKLTAQVGDQHLECVRPMSVRDLASHRCECIVRELHERRTFVDARALMPVIDAAETK